MKRILSIILATVMMACAFTGCSETSEFDTWQEAGDAELGSIDESVQSEQIVDDFADAYDIDDYVNLPELQEKIHYVDLNLFIDEYNSTLLEHQAPMLFRDYSKSDGNIEKLEGTYNHLGIVTIQSQEEVIKRVTSKFTASISRESQTAYAINLIYHTVPNATKKRLNQIYEGINGYLDGTLEKAPNYIIDNYNISIEKNSASTGFNLTISAIN